MEIFHPRQRRHCFGAVRHDLDLHGSAAGDRRGPVGNGTKVGLAPLHAWLPDAHAEGPTPISAVLSGLLLNVALYALLRFKMLLAANPNTFAPGPLMVTMGLISLLFAAFMLYRRRDIKRMFA